MLSQATALIGYQSWPHVDLAERGQEAAGLLQATLAGQVRPVTALAKLRMILPVENGQTTSDPMAGLLGQARSWERAGRCLCGSIYLVQPWIDLPDVGCAVTVVTNGDQTQAQRLADQLAGEMWQRRRDFEVELISLDAAIDRALQATGRPVVLADSADSTGSGAPGDSTAILARLLDRQVSCRVLLPIVDKEAVQAAFAAGQRATLRLTLGGKIDPLYSRPVPLEAQVEWLGEATFRFKGPVFTGQELAMGPVAVLRVRDIFILASQRPTWTVDPEMYRSVGLEPTEAQIVVVKSPNQFRAGYEPIAHEILVVDAPGRASANLRNLPFQRLSRPFYPFDEDWPGAPFEKRLM
jgi:microcystin degradation protein MlrC